MATDQGAVGLAEFTAALSLAADQAAGLSLEHGLRCCLLATRLGRRAGLADGELREVYYTALMRSVGCTSDAHEQAALFGDEIAGRTELPAISVPALISASALPIGVQIVAPAGGEAVILAVAAELERLRPWPRLAPLAAALLNALPLSLP